MPERQGHVQTARGLTCPLIFERGHLFATAGNVTFLLDTGAPVSFGRVSAVTLDGQRFTVAPTYLGLTKEVLSSHVGRDVDGLLGADILNQFDTLIDVGHSRVLFSEGPVEFGGEELALDDFMGIPILTAMIAGDSVRMFFDTGAQISYFQRSSLATFPLDEHVTDSYPGFGQFSTDTRRVSIQLGRTRVELQCGQLPELLGMTLASDAPEHVVGDRGDTSSILRGNVRDEGLVPAERRAAVQGACRL